jgi:hypothetical protein
MPHLVILLDHMYIEFEYAAPLGAASMPHTISDRN